MFILSATLRSSVCVCVCVFQIEPYLPYEFTCEGMLQRLNSFIENQVREGEGGGGLCVSFTECTEGYYSVEGDLG